MRAVAIVPAYNEADHIAPVIAILRVHPSVAEVLVIDDGSEDQTTACAEAAGARVVRLTPNRGKGGAMREGLRHTDAEVVLYIDADLVGLNAGHIDALLDPVLQGEADMSVGLFAEGRRATDLAQKLAPFLSGQRAMRREVMERAPNVDDARYGVEVALERYARQASLRVRKVSLPSLAQVMKEEKSGVVRGFARRLKMYWDIIKAVR